MHRTVLWDFDGITTVHLTRIADSQTIRSPRYLNVNGQHTYSSWHHALFVVVKAAVEREVSLEQPSLTPEGFHDHVMLSLELLDQNETLHITRQAVRVEKSKWKETHRKSKNQKG